MKGKPSLRTTILSMAAAAATSLFTWGLMPTAPANAGPICPPSEALVNPALYQQCLAAEQNLNSYAKGAPAAPAGPCGPNVAAGINGTCGWQANQPGLCALTGQCQGGIPTVEVPPVPAAPPPPPTAAMGPVMPAGPAPQGPQATPVNPGQCADLAYYTAHELSCAQVASPPPGWHPGMGS
jgi:hypothetical protein